MCCWLRSNGANKGDSLSYEMRAKGMAFSNLAVAVGGLLNQFAWPVVSPLWLKSLLKALLTHILDRVSKQ